MTKRDVVLKVRETGLIARWSSEWQEFIVNYRQDDVRRTSDSSYHTSDEADAIATAEYMAKL
jgi:hypothetical protein